MVEYRAVPEDDTEAFRGVLDYAFRAEAGPEPARSDEAEPPTPVGDRRGLYDGRTLVTTAVHHSFTVAIRDRWEEVAGLGAVATRPEHRRQGLVRRLLRKSLAEYRDRGQAFALLWPFKHAFYRRFGWGRLGTFGRYELAPAALAPVDDHPLAGGAFVPLDVDDIPALKALDDRVADRFDLTMRRTADWYRHRFFEGWDRDPYVYGWRRDGALRGYLRYDVAEDDGDAHLRVWELGAPADDATINLLRFLYRHDDQVDRLRVHAPTDERLFDLVEDPAAVDLEVRPGPMGRLVDVAAGLGGLPTPAGGGASVPISVTDPLVDWNDGGFTLRADAGAIAVEAAADVDPAATVSIDTLSRLALGSTTAEQAATAGGLAAAPADVARLDALFPPREGFLREFF